MAVVGPGALGRVFAACLSDVGPTALVARSPGRAAALARGFELVHPSGRTRRVRVPAFGPEEAPPARWAIVLVKGPDTEAAARVAARVATEGVLSLQNGWVRERLLAAASGRVPADQGATTAAATREAERTVWVAAGETWLPPAFAPLAARLTAAGLPAEATPDVAARRLEKLAVNLVVNPLTAVLDVPNGGLLEPELWPTVRDLAAEMHPVLAARGPLPDPETLLVRIRRVLAATAANTSSMRADVRAGRPTEIEELTGALLAWARADGRALPRHEALYRMVRALEQVHRGKPLEE
ncbi:2-dehydropantoate 2-reductase [Oceanithermus profundus DSM 14977]|uniref:2-dehydropantoate 2-reductase n=1 Tax=Oceanithermus profundus (strain DSM 14977 / NBRC 100410 / VKM B-2274 / 506) TaxID=670487 RepID=E4U451_OCEP5|nr:2-dehydropantoate 2-reductase [Oceanithermus profundus]ADR36136.1 2-dehydropantoate 2-reductase [Oceanithermus profundus DSM 14977]